MMQYFIENHWLVWTIIAALCLTIEMGSGDFFVTCFAIGAVCSIIPAAIGSPFWFEVVVFAVCSVLSIYYLRPRLTAMLNSHGSHRKSNADALEGRIGVVSEEIVADGFGRVKIDGDDWKAETKGEAIPKGTKVKVTGRESIILKVERA